MKCLPTLINRLYIICISNTRARNRCGGESPQTFVNMIGKAVTSVQRNRGELFPYGGAANYPPMGTRRSNLPMGAGGESPQTFVNVIDKTVTIVQRNRGEITPLLEGFFLFFWFYKPMYIL